MKCDQCDATMINGVFCHEHGCPNRRKVYEEGFQSWVTVWICRECGSEFPEGTDCDCGQPYDDEVADEAGEFDAPEDGDYADGIEDES